MTIWDDLRRRRNVGVMRCDVLEGRFSRAAAAQRFGFDPEGASFLIDLALARRTILALLQFDIAYDDRIMPEEDARRLLAGFEAASRMGEEGTWLYGNVEFPFERGDRLLGSWHPSTPATFDVGGIGAPACGLRTRTDVEQTAHRRAGQGHIGPREPGSGRSLRPPVEWLSSP